MSSGRRAVVDDRPLPQRLRAYGCTEIIRLDEPLLQPAQLDYLDLLPRRPASQPPLVNAVAEHQGAALLYVLDACAARQYDPARLAQLQRQLANRSDPAWLGVVRPGSLEIHPIGFHQDAAVAPLVTIAEHEATAPFFYQGLVHGTFAKNDQLNGTDYVFRKIYKLLTQTTDEYVGEGTKKAVLPPLDVLSMAGRALFFRFLVDRRIVLDAELPAICPPADGLKDAFANAEKAALTSAWLDETFNGDFLQLIDESIPATDRLGRHGAYLQFYKQVQRRAGQRFFDHLDAILNGWGAIGGAIQTELDWRDLDFAHIPVGVLSQVYESFSHRADHRTSRETSAHYTPRLIARLMVDQTFAAVKNAASAKVLDPACGAGIFLVLAFRRLVRERWLLDGKRPDTKAIQSILYSQLRGFEVSESALRLAALALYITAIEVNGTQRPPKALRFPRNLRGDVLLNFAERAEPSLVDDSAHGGPSFTLGSLGPRVPTDFNGSFDIVIGNPPWTRLREPERQRTREKRTAKRLEKTATEELNEEFTAIGRRVLRARGFEGLADQYENPDKDPDLPFLWRATEWAREGEGIIALALPARLFARTTGKGHEAWRAILSCISVTGLINGADLRWSRVWEDIKMPFCLLFARTAVPRADHRFYYFAPRNEPGQNRLSRFRIDYEATQPVSVARVLNQPWVLKTLLLGTWLDVEVIESLEPACPQTLATFWRRWNPERNRTGKGYDRSAHLEQKAAEFLGKLLDFVPPKSGFAIDYAELKTYLDTYGTVGEDGERRATAHMPRTKDLYQPPLVIIPKAPGDNPLAPKAFIATRPVAFSQNYYGYSFKGHPYADTFAALLFLAVHSSLFRYFVLMVSASQGADRMMFTKQDLDNFPFPAVSELSTSERATIRDLAEQLESGEQKPWNEIDSLLFRLYGLSDDAMQTVLDTLFAAAAYRRQGRSALERTVRHQREPFETELREALEPYFEACGSGVTVEEPRDQQAAWEQPWFFLTIARTGESVPVNSNLLRKAMEAANKRSASRILVRAPARRGLLLGLLNQRRWWTVSRARLCGQHIIRNHLEAFGLAPSS